MQHYSHSISIGLPVSLSHAEIVIKRIKLRSWGLRSL